MLESQKIWPKFGGFNVRRLLRYQEEVTLAHDYWNNEYKSKEVAMLAVGATWIAIENRESRTVPLP